MLINTNTGSKWGKQSPSKRKKNPRPGRHRCNAWTVTLAIRELFKLACPSPSRRAARGGSLLQLRGSCEVYAEATLSHQRPIHFCQESWKILLGTGAGPGAGSSCGEPRWGSAQCLQGGKAQARELGPGGAGGLASGPDVRRLRLEFMGVVMSRLVKLDCRHTGSVCHTGSASSWISALSATGVRLPLTSRLCPCWKAAPDCPAPQAGRVTSGSWAGVPS